jgi:hypothetical protein
MGHIAERLQASAPEAQAAGGPAGGSPPAGPRAVRRPARTRPIVVADAGLSQRRGGSVGGWVGGSASWLAGWLVGWLAGWLAGFGWLVG